MNIKHLFIIIIFSVSALAAMDKENKEVEAFRNQLQQEWNNKADTKIELDEKIYNAIQKFCSEKIQRNKQIQNPQEWYKQIDRIRIKLEAYKNHKDLCSKTNDTLIDAIYCIDKTLTGLQKTPILNQKTLQLVAQVKLLSLAALDKAKKMVHEVNKLKMRALKNARSQLRKKSFGPKVQQYVRKCTCCKKEVVVKCVLRK